MVHHPRPGSLDSNNALDFRGVLWHLRYVACMGLYWQEEKEMISAWHLLWIVPVSASAGLFMTALCEVAKKGDEHIDRK